MFFILLKINKSKKQNTITDETIEQTTRQKRPRRAALAKNYKEPSSSESESERQSSSCTSKEEKSKRQVYSCTSKEDKSKMQVYSCTLFLKVHLCHIFWNQLWSTLYLAVLNFKCPIWASWNEFYLLFLVVPLFKTHS